MNEGYKGYICRLCRLYYQRVSVSGGRFFLLLGSSSRLKVVGNTSRWGGVGHVFIVVHGGEERGDDPFHYSPCLPRNKHFAQEFQQKVPTTCRIPTFGFPQHGLLLLDSSTLTPEISQL